MSLLDAVNLATGNQPQTTTSTTSGGGSSLLNAVRFSRGEQVQTQQQVQLPEPQKKPSFFEKAAKLLTTVKEKFKIAKPKKIELPSGFNLTFTQPKTDFDLSPAQEGTSAQLTPQAKQESRETLDKIKDTLVSSRNWLNKEIGNIKPFGSYASVVPDIERVGATKTLSEIGGGYSEENIKQQSEAFNKTAFAKANHKANIFIGDMTLGLTGGILKPEREASVSTSDKVIGAIGQTMGAVTSLKTIGGKISKFIDGSTKIGVFIEQYPKLAKFVIPFVKNALTFDIYGQLDPDIENRFKKVLQDTAIAIPFSIIGNAPAVFSIPASFSLGFSLTKLSGGDNEDAIIAGIIMATFDAASRASKGGNINKKTETKILKNESIKILNKYSDVKLTNESSLADVKKAYREAALKYHPDKGGSEANFKSINAAYQFLEGILSPSAKTKVEKVPELPKQLQAGEYKPQDVLNLVIGTPLQNTPEGKILVKSAMEAKQQGQDITIEDPKAVKADVATSGVELADKGVYAELTPKQLESLKDEVKIGDSVKFEGETYKVIDQKGVAGDKFLIEGDNRRQKVIPKTEAVKTKAEKRILDNLNPTGGVLVDYTPKVRATIELGENITTLDKTSKKSANQKVIIYRGTSTNQKKIVPGDFVTTNLDLAKSYGENVIESEVKMSDVLDDKSEPLGKEYIYRPTKPVKVKPKVKAKLVPRSQVPVGEGKVKVSRLEARIKQSLGELSEEQIKDMGLAKFKEMNKKENIKKAAKYVAENPEEALDVLTGKIDAPKGILRNSILIAMQNLDVKDLDIATRLASLQSTRAGQEISVLTEVNKNLPVNILSDIIRVRTQALEKRYGGKSTKSIIKGKVKKGKSMIKAKMNWDAILQEVRC